MAPLLSAPLLPRPLPLHSPRSERWRPLRSIHPPPSYGSSSYSRASKSAAVRAGNPCSSSAPASRTSGSSQELVKAACGSGRRWGTRDESSLSVSAHQRVKYLMILICCMYYLQVEDLRTWLSGGTTTTQTVIMGISCRGSYDTKLEGQSSWRGKGNMISWNWLPCQS